MTFNELGVRDDLLKAIAELGFENPKIGRAHV